MKITPETAPVGARMLLKDRDYRSTDPFEAVIIEWSPSGKAVKLIGPAGRAYWSEDLPRNGIVFEPLPIFPPTRQAVIDAALLSAGKLAVIDSALDKVDSHAAAVVGVWRDKGELEC